MLSRPLTLATVMLLIGLAAVPAHAQNQNLEAGKSPSQIFAGTCTACHKSPRGLLKTVPAGSLAGFLRQHYTTSGDMASMLSGFLISNGAADPRAAGQPVRDAKQEAKPSPGPEQSDRFGGRLRPAASQEAAKPEPSPQTEPGRNGRSSRRLARPEEHRDGTSPAENQLPAQSVTEQHLPEGLKPPKQRLGKRGKRPGEEMGDPVKGEPANAEAARGEPAKEEQAKTEPANGEQPKDDAAKAESGPEDAKASGEAKSEAAKLEPAKDNSSGETQIQPADSVSSVAPSIASEPVGTGEASPASATLSPAAPAMAVPPPAPVIPAGPPAPPISQ